MVFVRLYRKEITLKNVHLIMSEKLEGMSVQGEVTPTKDCWFKFPKGCRESEYPEELHTKLYKGFTFDFCFFLEVCKM